MNYWLVKQEPEAYSWATFSKDKKTVWTGVRNYQARNNLRSMRLGDLVLYYHSVTDKSVMGVAKVVQEAYPDPTAKEGDWSAVELETVHPLKQPVSLVTLKSDPSLRNLPLLRHSRLSVMPIAACDFKRVLALSEG